jgi:hypothetical protein
MSGSVQVVTYNGTEGVADPGYSSDVDNLNVFYEVRQLRHDVLCSFTYSIWIWDGNPC